MRGGRRKNKANTRKTRREWKIKTWNKETIHYSHHYITPAHIVLSWLMAIRFFMHCLMPQVRFLFVRLALPYSIFLFHFYYYIPSIHHYCTPSLHHYYISAYCSIIFFFLFPHYYIPSGYHYHILSFITIIIFLLISPKRHSLLHYYFHRFPHGYSCFCLLYYYVFRLITFSLLLLSIIVALKRRRIKTKRERP